MGVGPTKGTLAFPARREDFLATKMSYVVQLLKKGENRIEPYLDGEGIEYASKN